MGWRRHGVWNDFRVRSLVCVCQCVCACADPRCLDVSAGTTELCCASLIGLTVQPLPTGAPARSPAPAARLPTTSDVTRPVPCSPTGPAVPRFATRRSLATQPLGVGACAHQKHTRWQPLNLGFVVTPGGSVALNWGSGGLLLEDCTLSYNGKTTLAYGTTLASMKPPSTQLEPNLVGYMIASSSSVVMRRCTVDHSIGGVLLSYVLPPPTLHCGVASFRRRAWPLTRRCLLLGT